MCYVLFIIHIAEKFFERAKTPQAAVTACGFIEGIVVVIQFPSGVVPLAEMAGFTPCMGICWSEIFLQGACPCLPPTSVF